MNLVSRFVVITALCLLLAGCYETFPAVKSATVTIWEGGKPQGAAQSLAPEQITRVSVWLPGHRWGWHLVSATYAPRVLLWVTHSDSTTSRINLMRHVLIVGARQRSLSKEESMEWHSMIGADGVR